MKYTKRDREPAILICQVCALTPVLHGNKHHGAESLGLHLTSPAASLAYEAWSAVELLLNDGSYTDAMLDGEAEALLRWLVPRRPGRVARESAMTPHRGRLCRAALHAACAAVETRRTR